MLGLRCPAASARPDSPSRAAAPSSGGGEKFSFEAVPVSIDAHDAFLGATGVNAQAPVLGCRRVGSSKSGGSSSSPATPKLFEQQAVWDSLGFGSGSLSS